MSTRNARLTSILSALILLIVGVNYFIFSLRASFLPGDLLSSLDSQAKLRGSFKLESISVNVPPFDSTDGEQAVVMLSRKIPGSNEWGEVSFPNSDPRVQHALGKPNIQIINNLVRQLMSHGIVLMQKDDEGTAFTHRDSNLNFTKYIRCPKGCPTSSLGVPPHNQFNVGQTSGGWLVWK